MSTIDDNRRIVNHIGSVAVRVVGATRDTAGDLDEVFILTGSEQRLSRVNSIVSISNRSSNTILRNSVPLIGKNIASEDARDSRGQGDSTANASVLVTANSDGVRSNNSERVHSVGGGSLTIHTSLSDLNSVHEVVVRDIVQDKRLVRFTKHRETVGVPLIRRSTVTASDVGNEHRATVLTNRSVIAGSNSNRDGRILDNREVHDIGNSLATIRRSNNHSVSIETGSSVGHSEARSRINRSGVIGIAVPCEVVTVQTIDIGDATINSHRQGSMTTFADDVIINRSNHNRISNHNDRSHSGKGLTTRSTGNENLILVSGFASVESHSQSVRIGVGDSNIVEEPLISVRITSRINSRIDISRERGGTTVAEDIVVTIGKLNNNRRDRINRHNDRLRDSGVTTRVRVLNNNVVRVDTDSRSNSNRVVVTRHHDTIVKPSDGRITIVDRIRVSHGQGHLSAFANDRVVRVDRHHRSTRTSVDVDGNLVNSGTTGSGLRSSHAEGIVAGKSRSEGEGRTMVAIAPGVVHVTIVPTSSLSGDNRSTILTDGGLGSSQLQIRSFIDNDIDGVRGGGTTIGRHINLIRTGSGNSQEVTVSTSDNRIVLIPLIGSTSSVRSNISIESGSTTVANLKVARDHNSIRSSADNNSDRIRSLSRDTTLIVDSLSSESVGAFGREVHRNHIHMLTNDLDTVLIPEISISRIVRSSREGDLFAFANGISRSVDRKLDRKRSHNDGDLTSSNTTSEIVRGSHSSSHMVSGGGGRSNINSSGSAVFSISIPLISHVASPTILVHIQSGVLTSANVRLACRNKQVSTESLNRERSRSHLTAFRSCDGHSVDTSRNSDGRSMCVTSL